jgi:acid stress-induced BolA-like protein IbaG/YrbA
MGTLKSKVESLVKDNLKGATIFLELIPQSEKLSGEVVWDGFYGKSQHERQKELRSVLRRELTEEEQRSLSIILTLTPAEDETYRVESVRL